MLESKGNGRQSYKYALQIRPQAVRIESRIISLPAGGVMAIHEKFSSVVLLILVIALHSLNVCGKDCEGESIMVR